MALVGLPPDDKRLRGTVEAIEQRLMVNGSCAVMIRKRLRTTPASEGAFLACSFWLVDNLVLWEVRRRTRLVRAAARAAQ
jgi:GH15 family glucan-1,4-alpha-glucosidase